LRIVEYLFGRVFTGPRALGMIFNVECGHISCKVDRGSGSQTKVSARDFVIVNFESIS